MNQTVEGRLHCSVKCSFITLQAGEIREFKGASDSSFPHLDLLLSLRVFSGLHSGKSDLQSSSESDCLRQSATIGRLKLSREKTPQNRPRFYIVYQSIESSRVCSRKCLASITALSSARANYPMHRQISFFVCSLDIRSGCCLNEVEPCCVKNGSILDVSLRDSTPYISTHSSRGSLACFHEPSRSHEQCSHGRESRVSSPFHLLLISDLED
jgi:hypothetical protein